MSVEHASADSLYDAACAAVDVAVAQARLDLARDDLTLPECGRIWKAFDDAERGMRAIRAQAERRGLNLHRRMLREALLQ